MKYSENEQKWIYTETEQRILRQVIKGRKYTFIAENNGMSLESLYNFLEQYCKNENCKIVHNLKKRNRKIVLQEEKKQKGVTKSNALKIVEIIEEWCKEHNRFPRAVPDTYVAPREEQGTDKETPEQLEKRIHTMYNNLKSRMNLKYSELVEIDTIENEADREVVDRLRKLEWNYSIDRKIVKYCKNAVELREWCKENQRLPRNISNVNFAKNIEEETEEQKEMRMYFAMLELEGKFLDLDTPLRDKPKTHEKRVQIADILIDLRKKYSTEYTRNKSALNIKQQLTKAILNGEIPHRNIDKLAEYYGLDLDKILQAKKSKSFDDDDEDEKER